MMPFCMSPDTNYDSRVHHLRAATSHAVLLVTTSLLPASAIAGTFCSDSRLEAAVCREGSSFEAAGATGAAAAG